MEVESLNKDGHPLSSLEKMQFIYFKDILQYLPLTDYPTLAGVSRKMKIKMVDMLTYHLKNHFSLRSYIDRFPF